MTANRITVADVGTVEATRLAAQALQQGDVVVVPTDTVYGLAADAFNPGAVAAVFRAKQSRQELSLPVMVHTPKQLPGIVMTIPEAAERLMAAFWPGPLTIVFDVQPGLKWDLGVASSNVAVRMPLDEVMLGLIRDVGPLAVTSANVSGEPAATTANDAFAALADQVSLVVDDGPRGSMTRSTIIDVSGRSPRLMREGAIPSQLVLAVVHGRISPLDAAAAFTSGILPQEQGE